MLPFPLDYLGRAQTGVNNGMCSLSTSPPWLLPSTNFPWQRGTKVATFAAQVDECMRVRAPFLCDCLCVRHAATLVLIRSGWRRCDDDDDDDDDGNDNDDKVRIHTSQANR